LSVDAIITGYGGSAGATRIVGADALFIVFTIALTM